MALIEHEIWRPTNDKRIEGQRIAIVGYSHYHQSAEVDRVSLTTEVIHDVIKGEWKPPFFSAIMKYFGFADAHDFWSRVYFFNFVPESIGTENKKYDVASPDQQKRGRERFLHILETEPIQKVFVFSRKGWGNFPETTLEEIRGDRCTPLIQGQLEPSWGTYEVQSRHILVCGFRHPQFANASTLREQVQLFLELTSTN